MCHGAAMSDAKLKSPPDGAPSIQELDRVRLRKNITIESRTFHAGQEGIVLHCFGTEAYLVEPDGAENFFCMTADYLEKL